MITIKYSDLTSFLFLNEHCELLKKNQFMTGKIRKLK
jgi:hypothetical protein